jgi:CRISPR-associated protein Csy3
LRNGKASQEWTFDALSQDLRAFDTVQRDAETLGALIADGLAGREHVLLQGSAYVRLGCGQEVFPSQELILDRSASSKSRTLYDVESVAAIHSQKLGNAVRTIDT